MWHVLRTLCTGTFLSISFPVARDLIVKGIITALSSIASATAFFVPSLVFNGYRGHFLHRVCLQLLQVLSAPKAVSQRWQVRWTRMRIFFSTLSESALTGGVHSPGASVKPYLANKTRAFSSWTALLAAADRANRALAGFVLGLMSLIDCCRAAGTEGVAADAVDACAGAALGSVAAGVFAASGGSLIRYQKSGAVANVAALTYLTACSGMGSPAELEAIAGGSS